MADDPSNRDESAALLREIRDLVSQREQRYNDHLAKVERLYANQLEESQRVSQKQAFYQWSMLFIVVFAAMFLALKFSG